MAEINFQGGGSFANDVVSLGGIRHKAGRPFHVRVEAPTLVLATLTLIAPPNPARLWLLITNETATDDNITVYFTNDTSDGGHNITQHGSLLINKDLPWTGGVWLMSAVNTVPSYTEVSIME